MPHKKLAYRANSLQRVRMFCAVRQAILWLGLLLLLPGCAGNASYLAGQSTTESVADSGVALAGIGAAGAGGYFLGEKYLGGTEGGILGAVGGAGIAYGLEQFYNNKRADAFAIGTSDGAAAGRAMIVNQMWQREAVFAVPVPWEADGSNSPTIRDVYVPGRDINGVQYKGDYQRVPVYK